MNYTQTSAFPSKVLLATILKFRVKNVIKIPKAIALALYPARFSTPVSHI